MALKLIANYSKRLGLPGRQEDAPVKWEDDEDAQQEKAWGLADMYLGDTPIPSEKKPEAVEVRVEADLAKHGLPTLVGIIDLVRPGGRIVDFKTSAATQNAEQVVHRNETQAGPATIKSGGVVISQTLRLIQAISGRGLVANSSA